MISVIVPVYNAEKTIERCIESVLRQTCTDWELVLVDDGSRDQSLAICRRYAEKRREIQVIHQENCGVSAARNQGIDNARGSYVLFLDGDDEIAPDMLEQYQKLIESAKPDSIVGSLKMIDEAGTEIIKGPAKEGLAGTELWNLIAENPESFGWAGGKCIRRELLTWTGIRFDENMRSQEDLHFNLRVYHVSNRVYLSSYAGYFYYVAPSQRKPVMGNFLRNQLMIKQFSESSHGLSDQADQKLASRISSMVFTWLYEADSREKMEQVRAGLKECSGLEEYLKTHRQSGEKGLVFALLLRDQYGMIRKYFRLRNGLRDWLRRIKK